MCSNFILDDSLAGIVAYFLKEKHAKIAYFFLSLLKRRNCALYMQNFRLKYAKIAYNYKRIIKEIIKEFLLTTYYYGAYARKEKVSRFLFLVDKS